MKFFLDKRNNIIWLTSTRNGSTILRKLSSQYDHFSQLIDTQVFPYLKENPDTPILTAYRDPELRFRSGLLVNAFNATGKRMAIYTGEKTEYYPEIAEKYKDLLLYEKNVMSRYLWFKFNVPSQNYHLFDEHLDHTFFAPVIIAAYGYNVRLIPMHDYSCELIKYFPDSCELINTDQFGRMRTSTSQEDHKESYDYAWRIYKEIMIDNNQIVGYTDDYLVKKQEIPYTFDNWMKIEKYIFEAFNINYQQGNLKTLCEVLLEYMYEDPFYLSDLYSPRLYLLNSLLNSIHQQKQPIPELKQLNDTMIDIKMQTWRFRFRDNVKLHL